MLKHKTGETMDINLSAKFKPGQLVTYTFDNTKSYLFLITDVEDDILVCYSLKTNYYYDYMERVSLRNDLTALKLFC